MGVAWLCVQNLLGTSVLSCEREAQSLEADTALMLPALALACALAKQDVIGASTCSRVRLCCRLCWNSSWLLSRLWKSSCICACPLLEEGCHCCLQVTLRAVQVEAGSVRICSRDLLELLHCFLIVARHHGPRLHKLLISPA